MESPLVSVIIPAYNHEVFVGKCLDSVLTDDYPNKEIVIINDGSTDRTHEVISSWIKSNGDRIRVDYLSRSNRGLSSTLNELSRRSRGQFIRIVASDDYLLPGGLLAQVGHLTHHPEKMAVFGDAIVVDENDVLLYKSSMSELHRANKQAYLSDDGVRKEIISNWAIGGPVTMLRRQGFHQVGGWSEDLKIEDWDLYLRLVATNALCFVDEKVGAYRLHGSNTCRTPDALTRIANLADMHKVARRNMALFPEPYRALLLAQAYLALAKIAFLRRHFGSAAWNVLGTLRSTVVAKFCVSQQRK